MKMVEGEHASISHVYNIFHQEFFKFVFVKDINLDNNYLILRRSQLKEKEIQSQISNRINIRVVTRFQTM